MTKTQNAPRHHVIASASVAIHARTFCYGLLHRCTLRNDETCYDKTYRHRHCERRKPRGNPQSTFCYGLLQRCTLRNDEMCYDETGHVTSHHVIARDASLVAIHKVPFVMDCFSVARFAMTKRVMTKRATTVAQFREN